MTDMLNNTAHRHDGDADPALTADLAEFHSPAAPHRAAPVTPAAAPMQADPAQANAAQPDSAQPEPRRWKRLAIMLSVPLLLIAGGLYLWLTSGQSISTDNAYVQQDKVSISAEITGAIVEVAVKENQRVKAGDLLFRIDPAPYRIAVDQALAEIAAAQANVTTLTATAATRDSGIETARRAVSFAEANLDRERALMQRGFNTRTRMDAAELSLSEAQGRLQEAVEAAARERAKLATGSIAPGVNPGILAAQARLAQARLQLARTEVRAPISGIVSQAERLQVGQMMAAGLPAVSIVASGQSWVEANFKETDLDHMRIGQRAEVTIDAYPDLALHGRVASLGAGTGSEFSVLPAQNATGNWVKVTQRVPVRIIIDGRPARPLIAGMSARVRVALRDQPR